MAHSHHHHREHQVSHRRVHHILKGEPAGAKHHHTGPHAHAFSKVTSKSAAEDHDGFVAGKRGAKRFARGGRCKKADGGVTTSPMFPYQGKYKGLADQMRTQADDAKDDVKNAMDAKSRENSRSGRYARGGKVKGHKHQTNIAIVNPRPAPTPVPLPAPGGPAGGPPMPPPGPGGPPMPPPGMGPPGMPMRARGGKVQHHIDGESTKADIHAWGKRASKNSYADGGKIPGGIGMTAGSATGEGRLQLARIQKRKK